MDTQKEFLIILNYIEIGTGKTTSVFIAVQSLSVSSFDSLKF